MCIHIRARVPLCVRVYGGVRASACACPSALCSWACVRLRVRKLMRALVRVHMCALDAFSPLRLSTYAQRDSVRMGAACKRHREASAGGDREDLFG